MEIETLGSKLVYENRWMKVREDRILRQNGREGIYGVVEKADFAIILPLLGDSIVLVEQYRYPVGERFWELPAGSWETDAIGKEALATEELREETGYRAGELTYVGELFDAYGYSTQRFHVFVARNLEKGPPSLEEEEIGLISRPFPLAEFERMIVTGVVRDAATVAAFGLARMKGLV